MIETTIFDEKSLATISIRTVERILSEIGVIDGVRLFQWEGRYQVIGFKEMNPSDVRHTAVYRSGFSDDYGDVRRLMYRHTSMEYSSIDFTIQIYKLLIKNGWVIIDYSCPCSDSTQELWKQLSKIDGAQVTICEFGDDGSLISEKVYDGGEFQNGYFLKLSGV